jgi:glycosyltransferase involved in cell wall biosynthesis
MALKIILNAGNLGAAGPEVVVRDLVPALCRHGSGYHFTLLLPHTLADRKWELPENCRVVYLRRTRMREIARMYDLHFHIARLCRGADVCVTLGDLGPINPGIPHVIFLHQPYLLCDTSYLQVVLSAWEKIKLAYQRWHFGHSASRARTIIVQTPVMAADLARCYPTAAGKCRVIPPALPTHVAKLAQGGTIPRVLPPVGKKIRLLFLAAYYAHKNHRCIPGVAAEIIRRGLDDRVHIYLTIAPSAVTAAWPEQVHRVVTILGKLSADSVAPTLAGSSALFLPTLAETYGLPYIEAIALGVPILTSDLGVARYLCGDTGIYFDPLDPKSIVDAVEKLDANLEGWRFRIRAHQPHALSITAMTNDANAAQFLTAIEEAVGRRP